MGSVGHFKTPEPIRTEQWYPEPLTEDDARKLFICMLHRAVYDLVATASSHPWSSATVVNPHDRASAYTFLLDPAWSTDWGGQVLTLRDILDYLDIDHAAFEERVLHYYQGNERMKYVRPTREQVAW